MIKKLIFTGLSLLSMCAPIGAMEETEKPSRESFVTNPFPSQAEAPRECISNISRWDQVDASDSAAHSLDGEAPTQAESVSASAASCALPNLLSPGEKLSDIDDCLRGLATGAIKGVISLLDTVCHPVDNVVIPIHSFLNDVAVINACVQMGLNPNWAKIDPAECMPAVNRMVERREDVLAVVQHFVEAPSAERIEMLTALGVASMAPGVIVRAAKMGSNAHKFGMVTNPDKFSNFEPADLRPLAQAPMTLEQVRNLTGKTYHKFVVTEEGKLVISRPVETLGEVKHPDLVDGKSVVSAGEFIVHDGQITLVMNSSGHYLPYGPQHETIVNRVFKKNGYGEAVGKYKDVDQTIIRGLNNGEPTHAIKGEPLPTMEPSPLAGLLAARGNNRENREGKIETEVEMQSVGKDKSNAAELAKLQARLDGLITIAENPKGKGEESDDQEIADIEARIEELVLKSHPTGQVEVGSQEIKAKDAVQAPAAPKAPTKSPGAVPPVAPPEEVVKVAPPIKEVAPAPTAPKAPVKSPGVVPPVTPTKEAAEAIPPVAPKEAVKVTPPIKEAAPAPTAPNAPTKSPGVVPPVAPKAVVKTTTPAKAPVPAAKAPVPAAKAAALAAKAPAKNPAKASPTPAPKAPAKSKAAAKAPVPAAKAPVPAAKAAAPAAKAPAKNPAKTSPTPAPKAPAKSKAAAKAPVPAAKAPVPAAKAAPSAPKAPAKTAAKIPEQDIQKKFNDATKEAESLRQQIASGQATLLERRALNKRLKKVERERMYWYRRTPNGKAEMEIKRKQADQEEARALLKEADYTIREYGYSPYGLDRSDKLIAAARALAPQYTQNYLQLRNKAAQDYLDRCDNNDQTFSFAASKSKPSGEINKAKNQPAAPAPSNNNNNNGCWPGWYPNPDMPGYCKAGPNIAGPTIIGKE